MKNKNEIIIIKPRTKIFGQWFKNKDQVISYALAEAVKNLEEKTDN